MPWDRQSTRKIEESLLGLAEIWEKKFTKAQLAIYLKALENVPAERVLVAIDRAVSSCKWFPKPAELIEFAVGNLNEAAVHAWNILKDTIAKCGALESVYFEDPRISEMVEHFGGWVELCRSTEFELNTYRRNDFMKLYPQIMHPRPSVHHAGLIEQENHAFPQFQPGPVRISCDGKIDHRIQIDEKKLKALPGITPTVEFEGDPDKLVPIGELKKQLVEMITREPANDKPI